MLFLPIGYVSGMIYGSAKGVVDAVRSPAFNTLPWKLRMNSIMNSAGKTSAAVGNSWAVLCKLLLVRGVSEWYVDVRGGDSNSIDFLRVARISDTDAILFIP